MSALVLRHADAGPQHIRDRQHARRQAKRRVSGDRAIVRHRVDQLDRGALGVVQRDVADVPGSIDAHDQRMKLKEHPLRRETPASFS